MIKVSESTNAENDPDMYSVVAPDNNMSARDKNISRIVYRRVKSRIWVANTLPR